MRGSAERAKMQKRQVASLSVCALFIAAIILVFPMATLAGSGSLNWSFWEERALCLLGVLKSN